jgi:hypothetical protein
MKSLREHVELVEGKTVWQNASVALTQYAKKNGGIDKKDMLAIANMLHDIGRADLMRKASMMAKLMARIQDLDTDVREVVQGILKKSGLMEQIEEAVGPMQKQWQKGAKSVKDGSFEVVRGKNGVHTIKKDGKEFGDLTLDDDAGMWVSNMKGMKGQWTGDTIDDLFKHLKKAHEEAMMCEKCGKMHEGSCNSEEVEEAVDAKKVVAYLVKKGSNPKDAEAMVKKELDGAIKAYPKAPVAKVAEYIMSVSEEVELDEGKSSTGYELYHKDFSSAMKHAYDFAKKKFGIEVDPKEIDDKVASGPRKPSKGKTNSYRLMDKDGKKAIQVQVYGMDNGKYELNMYKEEKELDEAVNMKKVQKAYDDIMKGGRQGPPDDDEVGDYIPVGMTKADMAKLIDMLSKKGYDKKFLTKDLAPLVKEEVELHEESETISKLKQIVDKKSAMKIDGMMIDMFTASAITQIYDKVNDANKAKMDKLKVDKLANLAFKMMKREGLAEQTIQEDGYSQTDTLDGSDLSHNNVLDPETLQAINAHIGSIAEREYMNPKGAMIQLQGKLSLIGISFDIPQFSGESGVEEVAIRQFGGITGKSVTTPIDELDNENPVENMKLRVEYETLKTNKVKIYVKIV